jgi:uncharacterized repeat protein (TIGR01451 family)
VLTQLASTITRLRLARCLVLTAATFAGVGGVGLPASAEAAIPVTPLLDCVATPPAADTADAGTLTAYFGYQDTGPAFNILVGDLNQVFPGLQDQDQPTTFSHGSFPDAFNVQWDPSVIPTKNWELNTTIVTASADSTPCTAGATGPASDLTPTSATLTGLINSRDQATSYRFDWGTSTAYGQSTPAQTASDTQPQLESESLTGLAPATTYHYRLAADNSEVSTTGADGTFTTPSSPAAAGADIALTQGSVSSATIGRPFAYTLTVIDRGPAAATGVKVTDALPGGLTVLSSSASQGSCSGEANLTCAIGSLASGARATITIQVRPLTFANLTNTAFASGDQADPNVANNASITRLTPTFSWPTFARSGPARATRG